MVMIWILENKYQNKKNPEMASLSEIQLNEKKKNRNKNNNIVKKKLNVCDLRWRTKGLWIFKMGLII